MSVCFTQEEWDDWHLSYPDPDEAREMYFALVDRLCEHEDAERHHRFCPTCGVRRPEGGWTWTEIDPIQAAEIRAGA